ncbi:hypothetical protein QPM17_03740 [Marinobacter sp. TBZ242]|uniref:Uncharacterized protein n=1 Tax=Marinobacter azerbaijanicus TaxID=3050455 RepID=A0ABT7I7U0_9GAMM|nr:hypothetical protein [Marinobacter sp. TBZ242]MDL0430221.1 hypothetical protein [Marinobacter sp. TBZ242]
MRTWRLTRWVLSGLKNQSVTSDHSGYKTLGLICGNEKLDDLAGSFNRTAGNMAGQASNSLSFPRKSGIALNIHSEAGTATKTPINSIICLFMVQ